MTLITLLIVLTIERVAATGQLWQFEFYYQKMKNLMFIRLDKPQWLQSAVGRWMWLLLPVLLVQFVSNAIDWLLIELVFEVLVLLICIGCIKQRKLYKSFLNAANRGDEEACQLYSAQLQGLEIEPLAPDIEVVHAQQDEAEPKEQSESEEPGEPEVQSEPEAQIQADKSKEAPCGCSSLGLTLVWFNFRYYCAVLFWFVCLGPAGAVLYCMVRESADDSDKNVSDIIPSTQMQKLLHILDWLPARVCSAGYLLIGNFSKAAGIWLSYVLDLTSPAKSLVSDISSAAETVDALDCSKITEPACMLKLAKRNILFFLAAVAVLTLYGGIK
jgi:AmpE protein